MGAGVVRVRRRQPYALSAPDFVYWVHLLNFALLEAALEDGAGRPPFDVIHAHDWLVAFAARALKHAWRVPLVATIHATEAGRHHGIHNPTQRHISEVEWWLTYEAWRVICCSSYMEAELSGQFRLPADKISVIPNGIDPEDVAGPGPAGPPALTRDVFAEPGEDIVLFVGRLVREKGVDTLLDAFPAILDRRPSTRLVIAGTGPHEDHLRGRAAAMGLGGRVHFAGYLDDRGRNLLYGWATTAVVPSYYEPFGLTALEAMAAGAPLVVSDTGGLAEVVTHGETGLKVPPANPGELAGAVLALLGDRERAARLAAAARRAVRERFTWQEVAARTEAVYEQVVEAARSSGWSGVGAGDLATAPDAATGTGAAAEASPPPGEDWDEMRQRTRVFARGSEPIGRYNPPS